MDSHLHDSIWALSIERPTVRCIPPTFIPESIEVKHASRWVGPKLVGGTSFICRAVPVFGLGYAPKHSNRFGPLENIKALLC